MQKSQTESNELQSCTGASDVPIAFEHMNESIVPWFRWKLLGDRAACEYFKAMPDSEAWDLVRAANAADCE